MVDLPPARKARSSDDVDVDSGGKSSSEAEAWATDESDVTSVCSDVESIVAEEMEEPPNSDDDEVADELGCVVDGRARPGTFVVWNNGYFTLSRNPMFPDAKIRIVPRWATTSEMGATSMSRTAVIKHYDEDETRPTRTFLVLRAWMIHRAQLHSWSRAKPSRQLWLDRECACLRTDIEDLSVDGGGTGSVQADALIRQWAPSVL